MALSAGTAYVDLALGSASKLRQSLNAEAKASAESFDKSFSLGLGSLVKGAVFYGALNAMKSFVSSGVERFTTLENSTAALTVSLQSSAKAAELLHKVLEIVKGTPFSLDQFAQAAQTLAGMGIEAQKIPPMLTAIGNAAASKGKDAGQMVDTLVNAIGVMHATGVIQSDELNRFAEAGVSALTILANAYGVTGEKMREMISDRLIPADKAIDILTKGIMEGSTGIAGTTVALDGTMKALGNTLSGSYSIFKTAGARLGMAILEPFAPSLKSMFKLSSDTMDAIGGVLNKGLHVITNSEGFKEFSDMLGRQVRGFIDWISQAENWKKVQEWLAPAWDGLKKVGSSLWDTVKELGKTFADLIKDNKAELKTFFTETLPQGLKDTAKVLENVTKLVKDLKPLLEAIVEPILKIVGGTAKEGTSQIEKTLDAEKEAAKRIKDNGGEPDISNHPEDLFSAANLEKKLVKNPSDAVKKFMNWMKDTAIPNTNKLFDDLLDGNGSNHDPLGGNTLDFERWYNEANGWAQRTGQLFQNWVYEQSGKFSNWFKEQADGFDTWGQETSASIGSWTSRQAEDFGTWFAGVADGFDRWGQRTSTSVGTWASNTAGDIGTWISNTAGDIGNWVERTAGDIGSWVERTWGSFSSWASGVWSRIVGGLRDAWNGALDATSRGWGNVEGFISSIPGRIGSFLSSLPGIAWNAGYNLIISLGNGIISAGSYAYTLAQQALQSIKNLFPNSPAKEGPFSGKGYTYFSGQVIAEDFAKGISDKASMVDGAVYDMMDKASMTLNGTTAQAMMNAGHQFNIYEANNPMSTAVYIDRLDRQSLRNI